MGYANETGYTPLTFEAIMSLIMSGINEQFGTSFTDETFVGSGHYKYAYTLAQRIQAGEVVTSQIFQKVQKYFEDTNDKIISPKVTPPGIIDAFKLAGYTASVKGMIEADAGKSHICVDVDDGDPDYAAMKTEICTLIQQYTVQGVVTIGSEVESLPLSNGQTFDYKFNLPDATNIKLKLTLTLSRNNQSVIGSSDSTKQKLMANIAALYSLGKDFEPERYFSVADAPWAGDILLEYSLDGGSTWDDDTYEADYDELFVVLLANITVLEA